MHHPSPITHIQGMVCGMTSYPTWYLVPGMYTWYIWESSIRICSYRYAYIPDYIVKRQRDVARLVPSRRIRGDPPTSHQRHGSETNNNAPLFYNTVHGPLTINPSRLSTYQQSWSLRTWEWEPRLTRCVNVCSWCFRSLHGSSLADLFLPPPP
jgi:hypothetical protein